GGGWVAPRIGSVAPAQPPPGQAAGRRAVELPPCPPPIPAANVSAGAVRGTAGGSRWPCAGCGTGIRPGRGLPRPDVGIAPRPPEGRAHPRPEPPRPHWPPPAPPPRPLPSPPL